MPSFTDFIDTDFIDRVRGWTSQPNQTPEYEVPPTPPSGDRVYIRRPSPMSTVWEVGSGQTIEYEDIPSRRDLMEAEVRAQYQQRRDERRRVRREEKRLAIAAVKSRNEIHNNKIFNPSSILSVRRGPAHRRKHMYILVCREEGILTKYFISLDDLKKVFSRQPLKAELAVCHLHLKPLESESI